MAAVFAAAATFPASPLTASPLPVSAAATGGAAAAVPVLLVPLCRADTESKGVRERRREGCRERVRGMGESERERKREKIYSDRGESKVVKALLSS